MRAVPLLRGKGEEKEKIDKDLRDRQRECDGRSRAIEAAADSFPASPGIFTSCTICKGRPGASPGCEKADGERGMP
jgi:hypothetical protein